MRYKTIVVHVDRSEHSEERMRHAARLAARADAHLVGSAFSGIARHADPQAEMILALTAPREAAALRQHNEQALNRFEAIAAAEGVASIEHRLLDDDPAGGLVLQARYADLVVVSQTDLDDPAAAHLAGPLPAQVVLGSGRPVLIIPHSGHFATIGSRAIVAWDGSIEATRAVYAALPLLQQANGVAIITFRPSAAAGPAPGADLALYLARHGVQCKVHDEPLAIHAGAELLSRAADLQCDLIVMGGYGHARLRELILGGVTETILGSMTAPVLMAH
jgi:nucleotide-binding universal stress UspA family protein